MKGDKILKITGIIMIVGGAISIILGIVALVGVAALAALLEDTEGGAAILYLSSALVLISGIIELVAGILGVKNSNQPEKAGSCIVMGVIVAVLSIVGQILSMASGSSISIFSLILGVVLPILYIVGAVMCKKDAAK